MLKLSLGSLVLRGKRDNSTILIDPSAVCRREAGIKNEVGKGKEFLDFDSLLTSDFRGECMSNLVK